MHPTSGSPWGCCAFSAFGAPRRALHASPRGQTRSPLAIGPATLPPPAPPAARFPARAVPGSRRRWLAGRQAGALCLWQVFAQWTRGPWDRGPWDRGPVAGCHMGLLRAAAQTPPATDAWGPSTPAAQVPTAPPSRGQIRPQPRRRAQHPTPHDHRPDIKLRRLGENRLIGDDIYTNYLTDANCHIGLRCRVGWFMPVARRLNPSLAGGTTGRLGRSR
jgi:hypothetical protein